MSKPDDARQAPGPTGGLPYFGPILEVSKDPLAFFCNQANTHGDIVRLKFGKTVMNMVSSPELVKRILVDNAKNYVRGPGYRSLKFILGMGLVTNEGESWMRQRRLAQPAFHRDRLAEFARWMADAVEDMFTRWGQHPDGSALDVHAEMMGVTLDIVGRALLSKRMDGRSDEIRDAMHTTVRLAEHSASPFKLPWWVPSPGNVRFKRAKETLDTIVYRIIGERREAAKNGTAESAPKDLLAMLMAARDEDTGETMTDLQLRDEVVTMVSAGHETTANAMTWALYLLSKHPSVLRRLEDEIQTVLGTRSPRLEDLSKLTYTTAVLQEAMRLYPPVWAFEREAAEDDELGPYRVRKGELVGVFTYVLHRNPKYWPNPEGFDPNNFLTESDRPKHAYVPFGAGPRMCIGHAFAMMEAQILLAMMVQRYRLDLQRGAKIVLDPVISLRPKHGMPMTLTRRHGVSGQSNEEAQAAQ